MARTSGEIQADIDRLRAARGQADARVAYDGNSRETKSEADITAALAQLEQELSSVVTPKAKIMSRRYRTAKGW